MRAEGIDITSQFSEMKPYIQEILIMYEASIKLMRTAGKSSKTTLAVTALVISIIATVAIMPLKYAAAQGPLTNLGDVLPDSFKERITKMKADHPELASLGEKLQTMNMTKAVGELESMLDLAKEMTTGIKNLQGNMTAK